MGMKLSRYLAVKDSCCLAYYGPCEEYLVELGALRPAVEGCFPGLAVYLACPEPALHRWAGLHRTIGQAQLSDDRSMGYIHEIRGDTRHHPVERFMDDNAIPIGLERPPYQGTRRCLILAGGISPTRTLSPGEVEEVRRHARFAGYLPEFGDDLREVGWVIGVECPLLIEAACLGIRTTLVPTGVGESLFLRMFPWGEVLRI